MALFFAACLPENNKTPRARQLHTKHEERSKVVPLRFTSQFKTLSTTDLLQSVDISSTNPNFI